MYERIRTVLSALKFLGSDDQLVPIDSLKMITLLLELGDALGVDLFKARYGYDDFRSIATVSVLVDRAREADRIDARPSRSTVLDVVPTGKTRALATTGQQTFYYLTDPDPASLGLPIVLQLDGPLDVDTLSAALDLALGSSSVFRTDLREIDGELWQLVTPLAEILPRKLDVIDAPYPDERRSVDETVEAMRGWPFDLAAQRSVHAQLVRVAARKHYLILIVHHVVADGGSLNLLLGEIFARYGSLLVGADRGEPVPAAIQYIDYAEAVAREAASPAGLARRAEWIDALAGAQPVVVPTDHDRAAVDARRDRAPLGIVADPMQLPIQRVLPERAVAAVQRLASELQTTPYVIYVSAFAKMLATECPQDEVCINDLFTIRHDVRALAAVHGVITSARILRIDHRGNPALAELVQRTVEVVREAQRRGGIDDYYGLVPHGLRRVALNYMPAGAMEIPAIGELTVKRLGFVYPGRRQRSWDFAVNVIEAPGRVALVWMGNAALFEVATLERMIERFVAICEAA